MDDQNEKVMQFLRRKEKLFEWLNKGVVIQTEWDNLIREADELGLEASKHQILRYYQHYGIGEMQ